jgi:hypothetical protein
MARTSAQRQADLRVRRTGQKQRQLNVWVTEELYSAVRQAAKENDLTMSETLERFVTSDTSNDDMEHLKTDLENLFKYNLQERVYPNGMTGGDCAALLMFVEQALLRAGLLSECRCKYEDMKHLLSK